MTWNFCAVFLTAGLLLSVSSCQKQSERVYPCREAEFDYGEDLSSLSKLWEFMDYDFFEAASAVYGTWHGIYRDTTNQYELEYEITISPLDNPEDEDFYLFVDVPHCYFYSGQPCSDAEWQRCADGTKRMKALVTYKSLNSTIPGVASNATLCDSDVTMIGVSTASLDTDASDGTYKNISANCDIVPGELNLNSTFVNRTTVFSCISKIHQDEERHCFQDEVISFTPR